MWWLLVALCLDQGLGNTIACTGVSHDNPEQFMNIVSADGVQASPRGGPKVLPEGPIRLSPSLTLVSAPMGNQGVLGTSHWAALSQLVTALPLCHLCQSLAATCKGNSLASGVSPGLQTPFVPFRVALPQ